MFRVFPLLLVLILILCFSSYFFVWVGLFSFFLLAVYLCLLAFVSSYAVPWSDHVFFFVAFGFISGTGVLSL